MKAAVLRAPGDLLVEERPDLGTPPPGWVRLRVEAVGICGSDLHYYRDGRIGDFVLTSPMVLGHEAAGTVVDLGEGVQELAIGQLVAVEPGVPCGRCVRCREGRYNLCTQMVFHATPPVDGSLVEEILHPAAFCHPVPKVLAPWQAALAEPVAVGVHALRRARATLGERLLVTGAGSVGLLTALAAREAGLAVTLVEREVARRETAKSLGLEVLPYEVWQREEERWDVAIECSGSVEATQHLFHKVRPGGRVVLVGMHAPPAFPIPVFAILRGELDVKGVFRYAHAFPAALEVLARVQPCLEPFGRRMVPLVDAPLVFQDLSQGRMEALKVMVLPSASPA